ncbi:uncharacterized mitochondrial protein AtMg00810-like [Malus sylvestris]|uniref:uncharacterized mitochondrial protein AtMg00810-like n=1 Tax=Malus sylvestris TaxID=3752 RepID=UPI0021AC526F|nr:uncharacterized mitochondrial protein AtMg00810-like [Malus sylvestris]
MNTVGVLLSIAVNQSWPSYQIYVKNAFLHGELDEEVYMKLLPGQPQFHDTDMEKLVVLIYVDDLIVKGDNIEEINSLKHALQVRFALKDLGTLKYFLGIEMATSSKGLFLNQRKYILNLLKDADMVDCYFGRGILMKKNGNIAIMGYTNADWVGNSLDRKSTTGFCTFMGGNLVTWRSKKQSVIAQSIAEAEYRAMASTACELIWLKGLL